MLVDESRAASADHGAQPILANAYKYWGNRRATDFPATPIVEREVHKKRLVRSRQELVCPYIADPTSCGRTVWISGRKEKEICRPGRFHQRACPPAACPPGTGTNQAMALISRNTNAARTADAGTVVTQAVAIVVTWVRRTSLRRATSSRDTGTVSSACSSPSS